MIKLSRKKSHLFFGIQCNKGVEYQIIHPIVTQVQTLRKEAILTYQAMDQPNTYSKIQLAIKKIEDISHFDKIIENPFCNQFNYGT
jgi:hypothetical protein